MPEPITPPNFEPLPDRKPEPEEDDAVIIDTVNQTVVIAGVKLKMGTFIHIDSDGKAYPVIDNIDEE